MEISHSSGQSTPVAGGTVKIGQINLVYYQANQRETFDVEFHGRYLCSPEGNRGGWPLMLRLQPGDIVFHYNSHAEAVLGISRVVNIGQHKGSATSNPSVIAGTRCIRYHGEHLSKDHFSAPRRRYLREKYPTYYEVHTDPLLEGRLGKLLARTPQAYLLSIDSTIAERFLIANAVELRGSSRAANSP